MKAAGGVRVAVVGGLAFVGVGAAPAQPPPTPRVAAYDLTQISLAELASLKVVSVSKKPEAQSRTAAAIHVITAEDIRRSGVRTLPELLRHVPGVHVAQGLSSQWAIGIRGFTDRLARSQLALIDGRSLYTPLFAGTYWEVQDVLLEDIDRIEVVRGPGGTLWGSNAVSGIFNVITKDAAATHGGFAAAGAGTEERVLAQARYGGTLGARGHYRIYGKYADRDATFHADGSDFDSWHMGQAGFRADWDLHRADALTLQGDIYSARAGQRTTLAAYTPPFSRIVERTAPLSGGNVLARWTRAFTSDKGLTVQAYYDRTSRDEANFDETRDTVDLDAQYYFRVWGRHRIVAGAAYRSSEGRSIGIETVAFVPENKRDDLLSGFVQDEIDLVPERLRLAVGTKVEGNDYTGAELQPSGRAIWSPTARQAVWAAVTRAVRIPSRLERELSLTASLSRAAPLFARVLGSGDFETERVFVYEAGFRTQVGRRLMADVTAFYNRYPNLTTLEPGTPFAEADRQVVPYRFENRLKGNVSGFEVSTDLRPTRRVRIRSTYAYLNMDLQAAAGSRDTTSAAAEDASPRHHATAWASFDLPGDVDLDARYRWVARLPSRQIDAYGAIDLRAGYRLRNGLELAAVGRNLLSRRHPEFVGGEIERSVFGEAAWRW